MQGPLVTQPALFVVQVDNAALHDASVTRVVGNKEQLMGIQLFYYVLHPHPGLDDPKSGTLLQFEGVVYEEQLLILEIHY